MYHVFWKTEIDAHYVNILWPVVFVHYIWYSISSPTTDQSIWPNRLGMMICRQSTALSAASKRADIDGRKELCRKEEDIVMRIIRSQMSQFLCNALKTILMTLLKEFMWKIGFTTMCINTARPLHIWLFLHYSLYIIMYRRKKGEPIAFDMDIGEQRCKEITITSVMSKLKSSNESAGILWQKWHIMQSKC